MGKIQPETPLALTFMPFEANKDELLLGRVRERSCADCLPGREALASQKAYWLGRRSTASMVSLIEEQLPCENQHVQKSESRLLEPTEIAIANLIASRQAEPVQLS